LVSLQEEQKVFLKLVSELGTEQQMVIKLKFIEELENDEIANMLGKNEGAIRVIQHRAIAKLKDLHKKYYGGH
jgi:RNA polymerase sigma factor (sigma-70 family)